MADHQISQIIESIKREDAAFLLEIYRDYFPGVRHYIMMNSGNNFDAEDLFQDAMVLIYVRIRNNEFSPKNSFGSYLNNIVRYLWLKELERKRKYFGSEIDANNQVPDEVDFIEDYIKLEKRKLILEHFAAMNEECKKILELSVKEVPVVMITAVMGYSSEQYTRNRKNACKERLVKAIWSNPRFKELKNEAYRQDTKVPRW